MVNYRKKIKNKAKHFLIPHKGNGYRPHVFREVSVSFIILISIFLLGLSVGRYFFLNRTVLGENISSSVLVDLTNESRMNNGKNPLIRNEKLEMAAYLKATDMASKGYFSHHGPDGTSFWDWIKKAGYNYLFAGENLAVDFLTSQEVRDGWLNSPKHKENIMANRFTQIGIATKEGVLDGKSTVFVVQMFGTPAAKAEPVIEDVKTIVTTGGNDITKNSEIKNVPKKVSLQNSKIAYEKNKTESVSDKGQKEGDGIILENNLVLHSEQNLMMVRNLNSDKEEKTEVQPTSQDYTYQKYSSYLDRFIYFYTTNLNYFYKIFALIFMLILIISLFVEYERKHWKHIFYGSFSILLMLVMVTINSLFL